jgi:hypothetical protein
VSDYQNNRPQRCGVMRAALQSIEAAATSAAKHYASPEHQTLLLAAMREIGQSAWAAVTADDDAQSADAAAFEAHLAEYDQAPEPAADVAHECGTPAPGTVDTSEYPARMAVIQRDLNDPESWVFRCGEGHGLTDGIVAKAGWQSPDYASEDDAVIGAGDHARAMHDMGLPSALAERVAAAERAAVTPDADHSSDGSFRYPVNHGG